MIKILFESNNYICIIKPVGVSSDFDMYSMEKDIVSKLKEEHGGDYLLIHRLDKNVSGVMILAKTKEAASKLSSQITNNTFEKTYLAVVEGEILEDGRFDDYLLYDKSKSKSFIVTKNAKNAKIAKLQYKILEAISIDDKVLSLVEIKLETGRTHQIRAQFSHHNHPIVGDKKYGSSFSGIDIALFSKSIKINEPFKKGERIFVAPNISEYPWNLFKYINTGELK